MLLNTNSIEQISLPVFITQITDIPREFRNEETNMLALWDDSKRDQMNEWLMKNYGVTVEQMRKDNQTFNNLDDLKKWGESIQNNEDVKKAEEEKRIQSALQFHRYLRAGKDNRCRAFLVQNEDNGQPLCAAVTYNSVDGTEVNVCDENCKATPVSAINLFGIIFNNLCTPKVTLLASDVEFVAESFKALRNYMALSKHLPLPIAERALYKQCKLNLDMYKTLLSDIRSGNSSNAWRDFPLNDLLGYAEFKDVINSYFQKDVTKRDTKQSILSKWQIFHKTNPSAAKREIFSLVLIIHLALSLIHI